MKSYYVYLHRKATTGEVFYVGKGTGDRAYVKSHRTVFWKNVVDKHDYEVTLVLCNLPEDFAYELERRVIAFYGRRDIGTGQLVNMCDGGKTRTGHFHTDKSKEKIRQYRLGKKLSEESVRKLKGKTKGRKFSEKANMLRRLKTIRPVVRGDGVRYDSIIEAVHALEKEMNRRVEYSNVSSVLRGKTKTAYGFTWRYA